MSNTKHTPGLWNIEGEQNVRAVAADLLAALRDAEATIAVLQPHNRYPDGSIKQGPSELLVRIRAAIAKAEQS